MIDGTDATKAVAILSGAVLSITAALVDPNKHAWVVYRYLGHKVSSGYF